MDLPTLLQSPWSFYCILLWKNIFLVRWNFLEQNKIGEEKISFFEQKKWKKNWKNFWIFFQTFWSSSRANNFFEKILLHGEREGINFLKKKKKKLEIFICQDHEIQQLTPLNGYCGHKYFFWKTDFITFRNHISLPSCQISEKSNGRIPRKVGN